MSELDRFRQAVLADQRLLLALMETPDRATFIAQMLTLAAAEGYAIEPADIEAALQQAQRAWIERWLEE